MNTLVRLSTKLVNDAKRLAEVNFRSTAKQIEYWAYLGKMAEENSDLPVDFIKGCLEAKTELDKEEVQDDE